MLAIENLAFQYPNAPKPSLCGVGFSVARGQIVGLLGPNGAGKTTLISHISGLLPIQNGSITVDGLSLHQSRQADPSRIAIAPQEYAFYPILSVLENLNCFASVSGLTGARKKQRVADAIAFTQLESHKDVRAEHLSGGLKRRLNLAIALLPSPDYLLLDEPTVGVDPQSRAFLINTVKTLATQGVGIIYTSHYMAEIEALADEVIIIDHGKALVQGTLDDLLQTNSSLARMNLSLDAPFEQAQIYLTRFGAVQAQGEAFELTLNESYTPMQVLSALQADNMHILHAEFGRNTLEQLFMSLTHKTLRDAS